MLEAAGLDSVSGSEDEGAYRKHQGRQMLTELGGKVYRATGNAVDAWSVIAWANPAPPLPSEIFAYLQRAAIGILLTGKMLLGKEIDLDEAAKRIMRNLEILEGNKPNAFKRARRDDDAVAVAALIDFFGNDTRALEIIAHEGGARSDKQLKAALGRGRAHDADRGVEMRQVGAELVEAGVKRLDLAGQLGALAG